MLCGELGAAVENCHTTDGRQATARSHRHNLITSTACIAHTRVDGSLRVRAAMTPCEKADTATATSLGWSTETASRWRHGAGRRRRRGRRRRDGRPRPARAAICRLRRRRRRRQQFRAGLLVSERPRRQQ